MSFLKAHQISGDTMTQQNMKEQSDINTIVKQYLKTGFLPQVNRPAMFGDFTSLDYMTMRNAIADIEQDFASLPSRLRKRFDNDPYQLIRWVENPANKDEAVKLGLLVGEAPPVDENQVTMFGDAQKTEKKASNEAPPPAEPPATAAPVPPRADPEGQPNQFPNGRKRSS